MMRSKELREDGRVRLLFLSDHLGYANGVTHGATTYFMNVLPNLQCDEVELTVCFLRERHKAAARLVQRGIDPIFLERKKWDPRALVDLVGLIRQRRIDIIHAAGMKGILIGRIAARLTGCRAVVHLHDTAVPGSVLGHALRVTRKWSDLTVVVSRAVGEFAERHLKVPPSQVVKMYNPIDVSTFDVCGGKDRARLRRELRIAEDAHVIGMTGRLVSEKGHRTLIGILPVIQAKCDNVVLLIVGEGPERTACEQLVRQLNLQTAVHFAGYRDDIPQCLAAVDVVAIPSAREGLSYSAMEAMASGRPVVAFAEGGLAELIRDGETGLLAPPQNSHALAEAIIRVLNDRDLAKRLTRNALVHAQRFSVGAHVAELKRCYQSILGRHGTIGAIGAKPVGASA